MSAVLALYPHQLFQNVCQPEDELKDALQRVERVLLLEDPLFFRDKKYPARYHIQRLIFHRLSMEAFGGALENKGFEVEHEHYATPDEQPLNTCHQRKAFKELLVFDLADDILSRRVQQWCEEHEVTLTCLKSPGFLNTAAELEDFFSQRKSYAQTPFYIEQRKRRGILLDLEGKPRGGKWSFDPDNRKKLPKGHCPPSIDSAEIAADTVQQAFEALKKTCPEAWGIEVFETERFLYPVTHTAAEAWLENFLEERLPNFGDYEDAMHTDHDFIYHSLLSPLMNGGLLTPQQVLDKALEKAEAEEVPLNAIEGFVRQILGWREYMRAIYILEGVRVRNDNFWEHEHRLPEAFYTGETGVDPVDHVIKKVRKQAYAHHIERLMVLGNFMCLCEIAPTDVYIWFMEGFIDAYDWVMVPNVYSMSQYADGGLITTKPYLSSSNYIRKMSNYPKGEWCDIWDGLYWRFIHKHRSFFESNPRLKMMTRHLDRMGDKLDAHLERANTYLKALHGS